MDFYARLAKGEALMRILGIDPGLAIVGWAVIDSEKGNLYPVAYGAITTPAHTSVESRLLIIKQDLETIIDKYSLFVILAIAAICISAGYLMFNMWFARSIYKQKIDVYVGLALLVPFVVYAIKSSFNKKINLIDAIILSGLISIPVLTVQVFKLAYSPLRVGIIGSVIMAWLILTFVRYTTFDLRASLDKTAKPACNCNCKIGFYYKSLFKKYGFFSALAIASLIALATLSARESAVTVK